MEFAGHNIFTRSVFPCDKYVGISHCHTVDLLLQRLNRFAGANKVHRGERLRFLRFLRFRFCCLLLLFRHHTARPFQHLITAQGYRTIYGIHKFLFVPRFGNEVHGSGTYGAHGLFRTHVCGDEEHHSLSVVLQNAFQPRIPLFPARRISTEVHVEQNDVGLEGF